MRHTILPIITLQIFSLAVLPFTAFSSPDNLQLQVAYDGDDRGVDGVGSDKGSAGGGDSAFGDGIGLSYGGFHIPPKKKKIELEAVYLTPSTYYGDAGLSGGLDYTLNDKGWNLGAQMRYADIDWTQKTVTDKTQVKTDSGTKKLGCYGCGGCSGCQGCQGCEGCNGCAGCGGCSEDEFDPLDGGQYRADRGFDIKIAGCEGERKYPDFKTNLRFDGINDDLSIRGTYTNSYGDSRFLSSRPLNVAGALGFVDSGFVEPLSDLYPKVVYIRSFSSEMNYRSDDQTVLLSGVRSSNTAETQSKVPILGDIPILGTAFRSGADSANKSELQVLVTPRIMNPSDTDDR